MVRSAPHAERHASDRLGWLRTAVLGAHDGLLSSSSLIIGVSRAQRTPRAVFLAGDHVPVRSRAGSERADIARERHERETGRDAETGEPAAIYEGRRLSTGLARQVAEPLVAHGTLGAHAWDELGVRQAGSTRPVQAALHSASSPDRPSAIGGDARRQGVAARSCRASKQSLSRSACDSSLPVSRWPAWIFGSRRDDIFGRRRNSRRCRT